MGTTYSSNRDIVKFQAEGMRIFGFWLLIKSYEIIFILGELNDD